MTKFVSVAVSTVLGGSFIPAHDQTFDIAESIAKQLDAFREYVTEARDALQADDAVQELLEAFLEAARPVYYAHIDTVETPIPADRWMAQTGGYWMAVGPFESEEDWFEDCDPADLPTPRVRPIADVPPTGNIVYMLEDFTEVEVKR